MTDCPECDGAGGWYKTVRVLGEGFDADQAWIECECCDGSGKVEDDDE